MTQESKCNLGQVFKADAVDMESFWIGEVARQKGLLFISFRSISDSVIDDLSFLDWVMVKGKVKPLKAMSYFMCHPVQIKTVAGFFFNFRKAGHNLAVYLHQLIEALP